MPGNVLAVTDDAVLPVSTVFNIIGELQDGGVEKWDPQIITQVSSLSNFLTFCDLLQKMFYVLG